MASGSGAGMMAARRGGVVTCRRIIPVLGYDRIGHVVELATTLETAINKLFVSTETNRIYQVYR